MVSTLRLVSGEMLQFLTAAAVEKSNTLTKRPMPGQREFVLRGE